MRRLCFLVPNLTSTRFIVNQVHRMGIKDKDIHVVGNHSGKLVKAHLHEASVWQTTNLKKSLIRGVWFGVILAVVLGGIFSTVLPTKILLTAEALALLVFFGLGFSVWASGMIGIAVPNDLIDKYHDKINQGQLLLMVDVLKERETEVKSVILKHHPNLEIACQVIH